MRVVGVDPGARGALAVIEDGALVTALGMPNYAVRRGKTDKTEIDGAGLALWLREIMPVDLMMIELVGGMPGQSASAAFNFGRAAGAPEYQAQALGIRPLRVAPAVWKRAMQSHRGKDGAIATASALWPHFEGWRRGGRKETREGMAEAALIALYGYRQLLKETGHGIFA